MAISFVDVSTVWQGTASGTSLSVTIPAGASSGHRMYVLAAWKAFGTTASITDWTEVTEFADGSVASGANVGSVKVGCWYKDHDGSESNPSITFSVSVTVAAACMLVFSKGGGDSWSTPLFATAAIALATNWTATASSNLDIPSGSLVLPLVGFRDDSATMTRGADAGVDDDGSPAMTWAADYVESPATHFSSTVGDDLSADTGYRLVTTGANGVTLISTGTLSANETGAALWVVQAITSGEAHSGSAALTGGGTSPVSANTQRNRSGGLTGGGTTPLSLSTARNRAQLLTGGGITPLSFSGAHNSAHALTGGGTVLIAFTGGGPESHNGVFLATGGGTVVIPASGQRSGGAAVAGGGTTALAILSGRRSSEDATGSGILGVVLATQRLATVNLTGGGIVIFQGEGPDVPLTDLGGIMDAIANKITAADITERAYAYPASEVNPPCAVVGYPDAIEFDVTYLRGADRAEIPVYFLVGRVVERAARDKLASIISGATGIKETLDGNLNGTVQTARVMDMRILNVQISGIDYLAARFNTEIYV